MRLPNAEDVIGALELPVRSRLDRRVPKKLLLEHGAVAPADRRRIREEIENIWWVATLKPTTAGVSEYRSTDREYLEISVIRMNLRSQGRLGRVVELLHRATPYPTLLVAEGGFGIELSVVHKRWSRSQAGVSVLDGRLLRVELSAEDDPDVLVQFTRALTLARQPRSDLFALYSGWHDVLTGVQVARITGTFEVAGAPERTQARRTALKEYQELQERIAALKGAATRERQMARRVELNLELKRLKAARDAARKKL